MHKPSECNELPVDPDFLALPTTDYDSRFGVHRLEKL
jgi:hypothetical protein